MAIFFGPVELVYLVGLLGSSLDEQAMQNQSLGTIIYVLEMFLVNN